jgi:hypothetical protein
MEAVRIGASVQTVDLYLSCGLNSRPQEIARWQEAFNSIRKDGIQQSLLERYHLALIPNGRR